LVMEVIQSEPFRMRKAEVETNAR
ncbi:MAG: hypothetical protein QOJ99_876, partial [Bryobacterales bacterium]|nr:hypothetical protein [Bryobacterales bacterium]